MSKRPPPRLLVAQYGDYQQAVLDRRAGRPETYRAQHYSMDCLEAATNGGQALIICLDVAPYDVQFDNFRLIGDRFVPSGQGLAYWLAARRAGARLAALARGFDPTHVVVRTPGLAMTALGRFALARHVPTLPLFADYFPTGSWRRRLRLRPLISLLNHPDIGLAANHNVPACQSMAAAGVDAAKIVPYDWPAPRRPHDAAVRSLPQGGVCDVVYAGQVSQDKGVPELLRATAILTAGGLPVRLHLFGHGPELKALNALADDLGLTGRALFYGSTPNPQVLDAMGKAALVVVPSRHSYPEGIPCVISEAFETRTPAILSDHPSFTPRLRSGRGCLLFPAGDADALAQAMRQALTTPETYRALSATTLEAWEAIQCPVTFGALLEDFMANAGTGRPFAVTRHSLAHLEADHA